MKEPDWKKISDIINEITEIKQKGISFRNYFHISLHFETLKQNESCKMFTSFQNALFKFIGKK